MPDQIHSSDVIYTQANFRNLYNLNFVMRPPAGAHLYQRNIPADSYRFFRSYSTGTTPGSARENTPLSASSTASTPAGIVKLSASWPISTPEIAGMPRGKI